MTEPLPEKPKRRPRYRGTHPRRFHEKYKELNPEKYPQTALKVVESGKTPAGSHRPICLREILEFLDPKPGQSAVDATVGYGGHALEIARRIQPGGRLFAMDVDSIELPRTEARLRGAGIAPEALTVWHSNYAGLVRLLASQQIGPVDLIVADLGLSSMQIDNPERGFTFKRPGPLDLRMNPEKGRPAAELLARWNVCEIETVLRENADEPHASLLARSIVEARAKSPITTTTELAGAIRKALEGLPRAVRQADGETPIRRVFQALRIAVNDEFSALETFLRFLPDCLKPGGRAAILTFHSGEDRRVKHFFERGRAGGAYSSISPEVIRPGHDEIRSNPRASSAKLRWAIRSE
jgi:16S rRNA (cytosine1402-N4)-methyltransferase